MPSARLGAFVTLWLISLGAEANGDTRCAMNFGFCQDVSNSCSGHYVSFLCDGPYSRRCCVPAFNDVKCHAQDGKCQSTSITCYGGSYVTGLCGGPLERRCCIKGITDSAYNDEKCERKGGKCQYTNISCVGGSYVINLCGGPANRRCCLPDVSGQVVPECGEEAQSLACELLGSSDVFFVGRHTSSATDLPEANLRDLCDGKKAVRSTDRCDSGCKDLSGQFVCLHTTLLRYLVDLKDSGPIVIDELTGACHKRSCSHQRGQAVDLHRDGRIADYIQHCHALNGTAVPRASVMHCQF